MQGLAKALYTFLFLVVSLLRLYMTFAVKSGFIISAPT